MVLSADQTLLFGVRNSFDASMVFESAMAMTSCDDWENVSLVYSFQLDCGGFNAAANQLITNADGTQDLVFMCADGFGAGPYAINRVKDVANVVANNPDALEMSSCSASSSSSSSSDALSQGQRIGVFIGIGVFFFLVYALVSYNNSKQRAPTIASAV